MCADHSLMPCHPLISLALQAAQARLPSVPLEVGIAPHWLAVAGVQPATAENAQPRRTVAAASRGPSATGPSAGPARAGQAPLLGALAVGTGGGSCGPGPQGEACGSIIAGLPLKHSMPDELQLYYDMVRRALQTKGHGVAVAASLATDPGARLPARILQPVSVVCTASCWAWLRHSQWQLLSCWLACLGPL